MAESKTENGGVPLGLVRSLGRAFRRDNWQNLFTGLGTSRDKTRAMLPASSAMLDDDTLENLYYDDDLAGIIVDRMPQDMLRMGLPAVTVADQDAGQGIAQAVEDRLDELEVAAKFMEGLTWGRLYGGAAIFIGADDGQDASEPLDEGRIKTLDWLSVLDRRELSPHAWYDDPTHPRFGLPMTYLVHGSLPRTGIESRQIHESRLIIFDGIMTSARRRRRNGGWGLSVLQRSFEALRVFNSNWLSVSHLMSDASQGVFKIKDLIDIIAGDEKESLQTRMEVIDMGRSVARALLIDADSESFERVATSFQSLPELLDRSIVRLAAAARMPVTILFGQSPAGMNATGQSDLQWWYDDVKTQQMQILRPRLMRLVALLFAAKNGPTGGVIPETWGLEFESLIQLSELEDADLRLKQSQIDVAYINAQVWLPEEVALSRSGVGGFSAETSIDLDARRRILEADLAALGEPEPPVDSPMPDAQPPQTLPGGA